MKRITIIVLLLFLGMHFAFAQEKVITGTVTSATDGSTIPGVQVIVQGTTIGVTTNIDGVYKLNVPASTTTLEFTFVGLKKQIVEISGRSIIDIVMEEDLMLLDEVIIVAYGTANKEAFTGAAQVVDDEQIKSRAVTSVISAIEGATTGVQMLSASGQPGSGPSIVIRGVGTLSGGTDPLYVVDGVQYEGALTSINPEDIKSMTVLKDAASTSLYGSRASNGVVLITTKSGSRNDDLKVNVSIQKGFVSPGVPFYPNADPAQYYELQWESYKNSLMADGLSASEAGSQAASNIYNRLAYNPFNVANDQIVSADGKINPNAEVIAKGLGWYDALQQTGQRDNYSVNVSGGNEKYDIYFSSSYLEETGYIVETDYDRFTTRLNSNFRPTKNLSMGASVNIALSNQSGPFSRGTSYANPFYFAKGMGSIYPVWIVDPTTGDYILDEAGEKQYDLGEGYPEYGILGRAVNVGRHALGEIHLNDEQRKTNNIGARYNAEYQIIDGLKAKISYGFDVNDYIKKEYENHIVGDGAPSGRYNELRYRRTVKNFNQFLTYTKDLEGGHNIDVIVGHESFDRHYSSNSGMKNTQTVVGISEFDNFSVVSSLDGYSSDKKTEGYLARLSYNYQDKYYLTASARRDGSSVFSEDVRWGNFYSISGSWRMDQETFIKNIDFIDQLKLRASFGQVGNDNLGDYYISQPRYSILPNAGAPGIYWSDLGNNGLLWETTDSWDVALDFGIFKRRIVGSFEYYRKNVSDMLFDLPIAMSNGLNTTPANIASMYNSGFELSLTGKMVETKDFKWNLTIQGATMGAKITDLPEPFITGTKRWEEGHSRFDFYIYNSAGVDPANGDELFYMYEETEEGDVVQIFNDDGTAATTNDYSDAGRGYVGEKSTPDFYGSITNNFTYKGFDLNVLMTFSVGGKILDYGYADMMQSANWGNSMHPDLANAWHAPGDITDVPRLENGESSLTQQMSTRFLTDASYLALRNVSLSYTFNEKMSKDLGVSSLRIFILGENLWLKSGRKGLDPQYNLGGTPTGRDYNPSRVISAGVNVSF